MKKYISFSFLIFILFLGIKDNKVYAQQIKGQIEINAGVGYSPGFDNPVYGGGLSFFPVGINGNAEDQGFIISDIVPNIGGTIDYGISKRFSIGLASSYQSELVTLLNNYPFNLSDKLTRINFTARILFHLNKKHSHFDHYIGIRGGYDYWGDIPLNYPLANGPPFFLTTPNSFVPSFQVLYGMHIYFIDNVGIHFEIGIGSPYLVEGGLTFRINTLKTEEKSK